MEFGRIKQETLSKLFEIQPLLVTFNCPRQQKSIVEIKAKILKMTTFLGNLNTA